VAEEIEIAPLPADQLVDEGHRMALGREAADGERRAVGDERRGILESDHLSRHPRPPYQ
jgi:hypothetical protein